MTLFKSLALAASLALFSPPASAHDGVMVTGAYALAFGTSAAVYLDVENHQDDDDTLLAAATDAARKTTIHRSAETVDGVMSMSETTLPVAALGALILQPGRNHIMLMGLTRKLAEGDMITLTLTFERAGAVTVEVPVLGEPPVASQ